MSPEVTVEIPRPDRSSRLLLLFRGFLLIPQVIFAFAVMVVALVAMLINYLSVLITGRAVFVPYLSGTLKYLTRIGAYAYFLTDKYPPFSLGDSPDYPVEVRVPPPGRIHRWRVFSSFLAIPHIVVLYVLMIGAALCGIVSWVVILITGRYPRGLFNVAVVAVRYQARVNAYLYLLTDHYPPFSTA